ncbi:hypothetical protein DQ04_15051020, partial [Trypanosoma grayi]|uniref:hypothetical protein n=1 Tax=Trypanosoma grayi TaxID=71804 RepID=UPI0004F401E4
MASNYGLAAQCQLRRDELHELLTLSAVATQADGGGSGTSNGNAVLPLWRTLLTAAHVRALVLHALVRVSVPKSKQQLLIRGNKYTNAGGGAGASAENNNHHQQQQVYRVGQIVALVP